MHGYHRVVSPSQRTAGPAGSSGSACRLNRVPDRGSDARTIVPAARTSRTSDHREHRRPIGRTLRLGDHRAVRGDGHRDRVLQPQRTLTSADHRTAGGGAVDQPAPEIWSRRRSAPIADSGCRIWAEHDHGALTCRVRLEPLPVIGPLRCSMLDGGPSQPASVGRYLPA